MSNYGYVYMTTNLIDGKRYIGVDKWDNFSSYYLGSGVHLRRAIKKYGKENFKKEIICECQTIEELFEKEIYYIDLYDAVKSDQFYNLQEGGIGGSIKGRKWSEESKEKLDRTGENNPRFGKEVSLETREKISRANKGFKLSEKTKARISEANKGENNPFYGKSHSEETRKKISDKRIEWSKNEENKQKLSSINKGKKFSEEHKEKIRQSMIGKKRLPHSEETKRKIKESWIKRKQLKEITDD